MSRGRLLGVWVEQKDKMPDRLRERSMTGMTTPREATPPTSDAAGIDGDGWLIEAERRPSPNCDARPADTLIDLLVIHNISLPPGEFQGNWIDDLFLNRLDPNAHPYFAPIASVRVSAHLLIRRDGCLIQYVSCDRRAWHAGVSSFQGRERCNDYSIGIELEGTDETPFTDVQYQRLADCTRDIQERYPGITRERIAGHSDIAPGRKTDPGPAFDWNRYLTMLESSSIRMKDVDRGPPASGGYPGG
jgi:AmpD protein